MEKTIERKRPISNQMNKLSKLPAKSFSSTPYDIIGMQADPVVKLKKYEELYGKANSDLLNNLVNEYSDDEDFEKSSLRDDIKDIMMVKDYAGAMLSNFKSMNADQFLNSLSLVGMMLKKKDLFPQFGGMIGDIFNLVVTLGPEFKMILENMWDWMSDKIQDVGEFLFFPVSQAMEIGNKAWTGIKDSFEDVVEWIEEFFGGISGVASDVKEGAKDAWDKTKEIAGDIADGVEDAWDSINPF